MAPLFKPLIFTFMTLFPLWGGTIQDDKQFQDAVISMGNEDKLVLMIYTTDSCPECAYMKQKVFHDKIVEPYMSRNFVLIEKNVQKNELPDGYDFFGIPTMFFIDRLGNKKGTIIGSKRSQAFLDEITRIKEQK